MNVKKEDMQEKQNTQQTVFEPHQTKIEIVLVLIKHLITR